MILPNQSRPPGSPRQTRRTWGQRLLIAFNSMFIFVLVVGGLANSYLVWRLGQIDRLDLNSELTAAVEAPLAADDLVLRIPRQSRYDENYVPPRPPGPAENFLIVGSDNATTLADDAPAQSGREANAGTFLSDTIMLLRVRPEEGTAYLLSIPRDLEVEIAGTGRIAKINSAYNLPDPDERAASLINTVEANLDVPIQHYVEIDLAGFTEVVDAIGGVDVCLERPSRDAGSGFYAPEAGLYTLDGTQALAYVRSRSMQ